MYRVLIVAPSLDLAQNVSGVSAVTNFIIAHNKECEYVHFLQGKRDGEGAAFNRILRIWRNYRVWTVEIEKNSLSPALPRREGVKNEIVDVHVQNIDIIHYNFPLDAFSIMRDFFFMRAAYKRGMRMVVHVHGGLYLFKERKPFIIERMLEEVFSWECPFIVLSEKEKEQIVREYGTKNVVVLPNCVDLRYDTERGSYDTAQGAYDTLRYATEQAPTQRHEGAYDTISDASLRNADATKRGVATTQRHEGAYDTLSDASLRNADATIRGDATTKRHEGAYDTERGSYDTLRYATEQAPTIRGDATTITKIEGSALEILYLGRIEKNKGMDDMLMAMRVLKERGRRFVLHFAGIEQGRNGYIRRFEDVLGDRFVYEGVVSGGRKTDLMRRCEVFLLPSLYEGLPMSLLETMGCGMVPVVTDVGSISEYVKDGVNGLMIGVKDAPSIVEAIEKLGSDHALLRKLSVNARETIAERCNPVQYIEKLNGVYGAARGADET